MKISRGRTYVISELTVDADVDFLTLYQAKRLASPASGEALRKGNKDILDAEVADAAAIGESKLSLAKGTQALFDKIGTDIDGHAISAAHRWTDEKLLKGAGAGADPTEIDVPGGQSFWAFPHRADAALTGRGDFEGYRFTTGNYAHMNLVVPADFTSLASVKMAFLFLADADTPSFDWTVTTDFAANGQASATHSDSATADGATSTADDANAYILEIDISDAFTGLAADDYVGIKLVLDNVTAYTYPEFIGIHFRYA